MHSRCHHRSKWWLTIERRTGIIPVEISPGIDQVKTLVIALYIHIDRIHEHGEDQRSDHRKKDCAPDIPFHFADNVGGELEADILEQHYTGQACQGDPPQQGKIGTSKRLTCLSNRSQNCFRQGTESWQGVIQRVFVYCE